MQSYEAAEQSYTRAEQLFLQHDRQAEMIDLLMNFGVLESNRGNYAEAIERLSRAEQLALELELAAKRVEIQINLGNAFSRSGDFETALPHFAAAEELMDAETPLRLRAANLHNWSLALRSAGRIEEANRRLAQLRTLPDGREAVSTSPEQQ